MYASTQEEKEKAIAKCQCKKKKERQATTKQTSSSSSVCHTSTHQATSNPMNAKHTQMLKNQARQEEDNTSIASSTHSNENPSTNDDSIPDDFDFNRDKDIAFAEDYKHPCQAHCHAVNSIVSAIQEAGNNSLQCAIAMKGALKSPRLKHITKPICALVKHALFALSNQNQMKRWFDKAGETNKKRANISCDKAAFLCTGIMLTTVSPEKDKQTSNVVSKDAAKAFGLPPKQFACIHKEAIGIRDEIFEEGNTSSWVAIKKKKGNPKVSPEIKGELLQWIASHPNVKVCPDK